MKTAKITNIEDVREWNSSDGARTVFYFKLELDNGEKGELGKKSRDALKIGDEITYTSEQTQYGLKFKSVNPQFGGGGGQSQGKRNAPQADYRTMLLSYAKDIVVARVAYQLELQPVESIAKDVTDLADAFQRWYQASEPVSDAPNAQETASESNQSDTSSQPFDAITEKQMSMITSIADKNGFNAEMICLDKFKGDLFGISKREASQLIEHLQAMEKLGGNG